MEPLQVLQVASMSYFPLNVATIEDASASAPYLLRSDPKNVTSMIRHHAHATQRN